uniref:Uncharacterized protein n=1 Tax=Cucumis melo TaxID=3656 RepID=A0A9I9EEQ9_CUCME
MLSSDDPDWETSTRKKVEPEFKNGFSAERKRESANGSSTPSPPLPTVNLLRPSTSSYFVPLDIGRDILTSFSKFETYERRSEASPMHGRGKGRSEKTQRLLDSTVSLSAAGRRERAESTLKRERRKKKNKNFVVIFSLSTLSVLRDNDAVVSAGRSHYDKDDGSSRRAPLHRRTSKRWLYWACPTPRRSVEIELPVPDTLPMSAECSESNSSSRDVRRS